MSNIKDEVLEFVVKYNHKYERGCPAPEVIAQFGTEAVKLIVEMKNENLLKGVRGRTGGLYPFNPLVVKKFVLETEEEEKPEHPDPDVDFSESGFVED